MSGIYIAEMEMPTRCEACPCMCEVDTVYQTACGCRLTMKIREIDNNTRPDWCPIVPVPPHRRLIDADALISDLMYDVELDAVALDDMTIVGSERQKIQDDKDFKQNCAYWLEDAPTIIPASE